MRLAPDQGHTVAEDVADHRLVHGGQLRELGPGEDEDVTVIAESCADHVLQLGTPVPAWSGDDCEVDVAFGDGFASSNRPEEQNCLNRRVDHLGDGGLQGSHRVDKGTQGSDAGVGLVDRVDSGPPDGTSLRQPEFGECLQRFLDRPLAVVGADDAVDLSPGEWFTGPQQDGEDGSAGAMNDAAEWFAEEHWSSVTVI